ENLKHVKSGNDFKHLEKKLEEVIQKKLLLQSFIRHAGVSEEEVMATHRDHVTDEAFRPFMTLKDPEKCGEWKAHIRLCIHGEVTKKLKYVFWDSMLTNADFKGRGTYQLLFLVDNESEAGHIKERMKSMDVKTDTAILLGRASEGELFPRTHTLAVIGSKRCISLSNSVVTMKEFLQAIAGNSQGWILTSARWIREEDLPAQLKLLSLVDLEFGLDPRRSSQDIDQEQASDLLGHARVALQEALLMEKFMEV
ncbi:unnamed protein product, partial [Darwinula stevensoni]